MGRFVLAGRALPVILILGILLLFQGSVFAHATLLGADPQPGSVTEHRPVRVVLRFTEPLNPGLSTFALIDDQGRVIQEGEPEVSAADPNTLKLDLDEPLGPGTYVVEWQTLSEADGHTLRGSYTFSVERVTRAAVDTGGGAGADAGPLTAAARAGRWIGLILWVGAAFWMALVFPALRRDAGRNDGAGGEPDWLPGYYARFLGLFRLGLVLGWLGVLVDLLSQAYLAGRGAAGIFAGDTWLAILTGSRAGWANGLELVVMPLLLLGLRPGVLHHSVLWRLLAAIGSFVLGVRAFSGHAAAVATFGLTAQLVDWIHLLAAAYWVGGAAVAAFVLLPLGKGRPAGLAAGAKLEWLKAFSPGAAMTFVILVLTGLASTEIQVGSIPALVVSDYGRTLLIKVLLVLAMAGAAALHTFWLRPRLERGGGGKEGAERSPFLVRLVQGEALLGLLVLASVGLLATMTPPAQDPTVKKPITIPPYAAQPLTIREEAGGDRMVETTLYPGPQQRLAVEVLLRDAYTGELLEGVEQVTVTLEREGAEEVSAPAERHDPARYRTELALPAAGRWQVAVRFIDGGEEKEARFTARLPTQDASLLLARAVETMNRLDSVAMEQSLSDGRAEFVSHWQFVAPDRMRGEWNDNAQIGIDTKRYMRLPDGTWRVGEWPGEGFRWPRFDYLLADPREVTLLTDDRLNDVPIWVVAFLDGPTDTRIRLWIGQHDYRIYKERMVVEGHIMTNTYSNFNEPFTIEAPSRTG